MILLTGATGFVGSNLARELIKNGYRIRCLVRNAPRAGWLRELGCELKEGDILDTASVADSVDEDIDAVIHLVGILTETRGRTFRDVHTTGTLNMLSACKKGRIKRYLHVSALGTRENARSNYHRTKWEAEELVRNANEEFGLEYTIFRPSVLFGKEDRFTNVFARLLRLFPVVFIPGSGKNLMQPLFVGDLARMMRMSVGKKEALNRVYEAGGPEKLTFDGIIDRIAEALGKKAVKIHVPMPLMKPAALLSEIFLSRPTLSRDALVMLGEDNVTDDRAIEETFGIKPTGFLEGMRTYLH